MPIGMGTFRLIERIARALESIARSLKTITEHMEA